MVYRQKSVDDCIVATVRTMIMKDKRKPGSSPIDPKLIQEGIAQLSSEIDILESWLEDIKARGDTSPEAIETRNSYLDMLRSRREMLSALNKQAQGD